MDKFLNFWPGAWIALAVVIMIALSTCMPFDSTDDVESGERSGMQLYTDHATGCQYLEAGLIGGITPRLTADGEHMGCRSEDEE